MQIQQFERLLLLHILLNSEYPSLQVIHINMKVVNKMSCLKKLKISYYSDM